MRHSTIINVVLLLCLIALGIWHTTTSTSCDCLSRPAPCPQAALAAATDATEPQLQEHPPAATPPQDVPPNRTSEPSPPSHSETHRPHAEPARPASPNPSPAAAPVPPSPSPALASPAQQPPSAPSPLTLRGSENSTDADLDIDRSRMQHIYTFCKGYVQQCATKGMRPSSCAARLRNYGPCTALRAGNFGMGLRCESPTGPLVMKVVLLEKDNLNTVRNSAKEVLIGCQASALKLHGVLDLFAEVYDFLWCAPGDAVAFLSSVDLSNVSSTEMTQASVRGLVRTARSHKVSSTFMLLGMVAVPDSPSKPFLGYADPTMVFEIFYTIITFNYVLDYCMTDMRTHHVGTKQVPFHRHYEVLGTDVLLPPGRMVKFIDMGSYRTRHHPNPTAKAVLTLSYYFTMWVTDQQLDPEARELWYWSQRPDVVDLPPLQALRKFAAHFVGRFPQFAGSPRAKWRGVRNVRHYRVPSAAEAREVATTYHNVYDYHWQVMPVSTT